MSLKNVTKSTYKQSLRDFLFYVILTISYLRAQTIKMSSLPNDSMRLMLKQIEIFLGILTVLFSCKYFLKYSRELLVVPPRDFASSDSLTFLSSQTEMFHGQKKTWLLFQSLSLIGEAVVKKKRRKMFHIINGTQMTPGDTCT